MQKHLEKVKVSLLPSKKSLLSSAGKVCFSLQPALTTASSNSLSFRQVYVTLAGALLVSAVGVVCNMLTGLGGWLAAIALFGCTFGLLLVEPTPYNLNKR